MSRIGRKPIAVPAGVKVTLKGNVATVQGPKGTLDLKFNPAVSVKWDEGEKAVNVSIDPKDADNTPVRAAWGSTRAHLQNMVIGVTQGYEKSLEVVGVGWVPSLAAGKLKLVVGFANPILLDIPKGVTIAVDKQFVKVQGADKGIVGRFASEIRSTRKPEPYNGKGIKYTTETIKRKQGKTFGA
jgi:large subunit ribosomal protein L6